MQSYNQYSIGTDSEFVQDQEMAAGLGGGAAGVAMGMNPWVMGAGIGLKTLAAIEMARKEREMKKQMMEYQGKQQRQSNQLGALQNLGSIAARLGI